METNNKPDFHHIDHIIKIAFIAGRSKQSWESFRKENWIDNIREAASNLRDQHLDMINEIETAGPEVEKLESENQALKSELEESEGRNGLLETEVDCLQSELRQADTKFHKATFEDACDISELKSELDRTTSENKNLKARHSELYRQLEGQIKIEEECKELLAAAIAILPEHSSIRKLIINFLKDKR